MTGFSFVDELTAGMPQPGARAPLADDLGFLAGQGLALLVSLTVEPVPPEELAAFGLEGLHLPVVDMTPPTYEQQVAFVEEMLVRAELGEPVGVHCTAGLGRTGTMLATWFVAGGMDAETAMATIRSLRPGSIETDAQEQAVRTFAARWSTEG
jgi:atypical dual specificity phosphatase